MEAQDGVLDIIGVGRLIVMSVEDLRLFLSEILWLQLSQILQLHFDIEWRNHFRLGSLITGGFDGDGLVCGDGGGVGGGVTGGGGLHL